MIDKILNNSLDFAILGFVGLISSLIVLGIAWEVAKRCWRVALQVWRVALRVWKWIDKKLSAPKAQVVCKPQSKPQPKPRDTKPLKGQPDWQTSKVAFTKTLPPTNPSTMPQTMPPIYYH
jgi:hypothetical protein